MKTTTRKAVNRIASRPQRRKTIRARHQKFLPLAWLTRAYEAGAMDVGMCVRYWSNMEYRQQYVIPLEAFAFMKIPGHQIEPGLERLKAAGLVRYVMTTDGVAVTPLAA